MWLQSQDLHNNLHLGIYLSQLLAIYLPMLNSEFLESFCKMLEGLYWKEKEIQELAELSYFNYSVIL